MPTKRKSGDVIDKWTLIDPLGEGGNAEVWKASGPQGEVVALKILNSKNLDSEPYRRFSEEVKVIAGLSDTSGIVPIIDFCLPNRGADARAWLAMPVAVKLRDALGNDPTLDDVVGAVLAIAETLSRLAQEGIHHRDIKPDNLFELDGDYVIGDFGLVSYPNKDEVTEIGKRIGPKDYVPPEFNPVGATTNAGPADVYMLAKTLWVLATGRESAVPGEQRIDVPALTISYYVRHPRARQLDLLVERATRHIPRERPSMTEFAAELKAWLTPLPATGRLEDLSIMAPMLMASNEPAVRADQALEALRAQISSAIATFHRLLSPIAEDLQRNGLIPRTLTFSREGSIGLGGPDIGQLARRGGGVLSIQGLGRRAVLVIGFEGRGYVDGRLKIYVAINRRIEKDVKAYWSDDRVFLLNSAQQEHAMAELANGITQNLPSAVRQFLEELSELN